MVFVGPLQEAEMYELYLILSFPFSEIFEKFLLLYFSAWTRPPALTACGEKRQFHQPTFGKYSEIPKREGQESTILQVPP